MAFSKDPNRYPRTFKDVCEVARKAMNPDMNPEFLGKDFELQIEFDTKKEADAYRHQWHSFGRAVAQSEEREWQEVAKAQGQITCRLREEEGKWVLKFVLKINEPASLKLDRALADFLMGVDKDE